MKGCEFDKSLPVVSKALILATVFHIDFAYFEDSEHKGASGGQGIS